MSKYGNPEDGGQSKYWDGFTGGLTAKTPRFKCQDNEPPCPRYGDDWADAAFNIKVKAPLGFDKSKL